MYIMDSLEKRGENVVWDEKTKEVQDIVYEERNFKFVGKIDPTETKKPRPRDIINATPIKVQFNQTFSSSFGMKEQTSPSAPNREA